MIKVHQQFDLLGKKILEKVILKPPFRFIARMPNEACFYYVVSGKTNTISTTQSIPVQTSEGLVLRCGNYLNEYIESQESEHCEAIAIHLYPDILRMIYDKELPDFLLNLSNIKPAPYQIVKSSALLKNYIDSLQFYFENPQLISDELLKLKIKELLLLLAKTDNVETLHLLMASLFKETSINFKQLIEDNLYKNYSLEELAALSNLSLSSFKREFTKHYAQSPAKYIKQRKLEQATKLLKATQLRISDIAFDCGFADLAHFSKSFQKKYKLTPSEYRLD